MADYKRMYMTLLDATEKAINQLIAAERKCEEIYISSEEETTEDEDTEN